MRIESLEEFCTLSRLLNYTKASAELHESQSTLSRHIKAMELELGFPLIGNINNQLFVTREGNIFLNGIFPMVEEYRKLVETCRELRDSITSELVIQEPPFQDLAGVSFLRQIARFKSISRHTFIRYKDLRRSLEEALSNGDVDVALDYCFGDLSKRTAEYEESGLTPVLICDTPMLVCCYSDNPLAEHDELEVRDILDYPIMAMYDAFSPARRAVVDMLNSFGGPANIVNCAVSSVFEFFMAPMPDRGIYVVPKGVENGAQMVSRENLTFIPLKDVSLHFFALFRPDYEESPDLVAFRHYLNDASIPTIV